MEHDRTTMGGSSGLGKLTPFGEVARRIRREKGILLLDMAKAATVTPGFLSLVETGKKQIPEYLVGRIARGLDLSAEQFAELQNAAALSAREFRIDLGHDPSVFDRRVAHAMQTGFAKMTPMQKRKILKLLTEKD